MNTILVTLPDGQQVAVEVHDGGARVMHREHPSDMWSPPLPNVAEAHPGAATEHMPGTYAVRP